MDRVGNYLHIPSSYAPFLDGLRWSAGGEAVEYADGRTFVFAPQLALFLEGLAAERGPIHFGFVLHLLALLGLGKEDVRAAELAQAFRESGQPLRNAGALCALLCRPMPSVPYALDVDLVCRRLGSPSLMAEFAQGQALGWYGDVPDRVPPWSGHLFESVVLRALEEIPPPALRHWLRHGRAPLDDAGGRLARSLPAARPRTLAHALAELTQHRRVAAAVPFVAQLSGALALPPRRLARHELPMGGYADVATRGHPEQLLPSQFVLEDLPLPGEAAPRPGALSLEFLRRYAENELLYFRREEPHTRLREELVLLLDQGVRTWGDVRLVLTAAVLAFGKLAGRRGLPLWLAGTSSDGHLLDPVAADAEALARLVEASDLSGNPGLALEHVLEERAVAGAAATDVVLLTHPRNLAEADVAAAARRVCPGLRLFAVAVDGRGDVLLAELKHGVPVKINQFHVDLSRPAEPPPARHPPPEPAAAPWQGDVEPVPFPFRFGVTAPATVQFFAFDHESNWVLQLSHNGLLHAWRCDGTAVEVLPRGFVNGAVLTNVDAVRGVAGGFVVAGRLRGELAAVHYDLARRTCRVHLLGSAGQERWQWHYFPDLHCVTALGGQDQAGQAICTIEALDLATGARARHLPGGRSASGERVREAHRRTVQHQAPSPFVPIVDENLPSPGVGPCLRLDRASGRLTLQGTVPAWVPFVPLADGRPLLQGARLLFAKYHGNVLAVDCYYPDRGGQRVLRLFRGPDGEVLGELMQPPRLPGFIALSPDGRLLAREINRTEIEVRALDEGLRVVRATPRGKCHQGLSVELGEMWLTLRVGRSNHLLHWDRGPLECAFGIGDRDRFVRQQLAGSDLPTGGATASAAGLPAFVHYDRLRFQTAARAGLVAVVDVYGQVSVFTPAGRLVAMFFAFRGQVAAWLPDGTRFGPAALVGGPSTPDAPRRIGAALREAWSRRQETTP
jgi:hypothetical protein